MISIVIPVYNNVDTIEGAIRSAINQCTNINYQILILDNNSSDGSGDIIAKYKSDLEIVRLDDTVSMYDNHNACLSHARHDWVLYCHADDELAPSAISTLANYLERNDYPMDLVVFGQSLYNDFAPSLKSAGLYYNTKVYGQKCFDVFKWGGLTPSGTLFPRDRILDIGGFLRVEHHLALGDLYSYWRFFLNGMGFVQIDSLLFYRFEASTARPELMKKSSVYESHKDGLKSLLDALSEREIAVLMTSLKRWELPIRLILVLSNYRSDFSNWRCLVSILSKRPISIFKSEFWLLVNKTCN